MIKFNPYISSPLNYIGGKYKLLPQLLPLFPDNIKTFVDLFCGGCNVGINISASKIVFNDNLVYLIDLYKEFQRNEINEIINHIDKRIDEYNLSLTNEDGYKKLRAFYNKERNSLDLFVLIAYSFNHQIRFNNSHAFNNPFGRERSSFNTKMKENLFSFLGMFRKKEIEFTCYNFDDFDFSNYTSEDYIYCDPPYLITSGTYNDGKRGFTGWSKLEEYKLLNILSELNKRGIRFGLSNVLTHKGRTNTILQQWILENDLYVWHLDKSYSNSNYQSNKTTLSITDEVFISNYKSTPAQLALNF